MDNKFKVKEPMFNFGEIVPVYLAGVLIAIHIAINFIPRSVEGFFVLFGILRPLGVPGTNFLSSGISLVGSGFLHISWSHVLINSGMAIVFGIATIRGIKARKHQKTIFSNANLSFLLVFLSGVIIGGIFQWGWWSASGAINASAVGASGGTSALFAMAAWAIGGRDRMLKFGIGWGVINIIMVLAGPVGLAWAAHLGGYIAGMILAPILVMARSTRLGVN